MIFRNYWFIFCKNVNFTSQPLKQSCFNFLKHNSCKYYPIRLCQTNNFGLSVDFLETTLVKKYFNLIQKDSSYVKSSSKENSERIQNILKLLELRKQIETEILELEKLPTSTDTELAKLVRDDMDTYFKKLEDVKNQLLINIFPVNEKEENDDNRTVEIQVIPAIGGEEAWLFSKSLFNMYVNYCEYKNWEVVQSEFKEQGSSNIIVSGQKACTWLKYEAGVHRVQRVPETEKAGRTHTSTCSIAVIPYPKSHEIVLNEKDLKIETVKSRGPGGQNINKSENGIRIKHLPTGLVVFNQTSRLQHKNKEAAIENLRCTLYRMEKEKQNIEKSSLSKSQIGRNEYSDKIRTYQYSQNRVTDHRINYSIHDVKGFISGGKDLDEMIEKVYICDRVKTLLNYISEAVEKAENLEKKL